MHIKEVRINNYKTYKNARIKFHPRLNIIVGPNGSGKSNLIEAILYGLGERSMKVFRAYKYKDLLPADTKNSSKVLSVTLVIDDGEGNEHIFKRIYNANTNTHAYYYNRKRVSRGVYISKLATLGYKGLHHVYIPQGGIISKANITSRDLRDIVDEALGIKEFNLKRQEALDKLEKAEAKLETIKEKQEIMREVIERLMTQMISYGRKRNIDHIHRRVRAYKLAKENEELNSKLERYNVRMKKLKNAQERLRIRMQNIENKIAKIDARTKKLREELKEREEYQELLRKHSNVVMEISLSERKIKELESKKDMLNFDLTRIEEDLNNIKNEVVLYSQTLKEITLANRKLNAELTSLKNEREKIQRKVDQLRNRLEEKIRDKEKLEEEKEALIKKEIDTKAEKLAIKKIRDIYIEKKKEMEDKRKKYLDTIQKFEERIKLLKERKETIENRLRKLRKERDKITSKYREVKREVRDAEKLLGKVEKYIEKLRKEEEIRNAVFKNNAEYILNVSKDMNLKGVIGILGDLIEGPPEIVNILSRYLGREWYSIIVYDEATARKLFKLSESLKKKVIIKPLTKYVGQEKELHERSVINLLKIKYFNRLRPIISSIFGGLVLTSDLEEGMELLDKGYGIISKKGDFIITPDNWIYEGRKRVVLDEDLSKIEAVYEQFKKMIQIRREDLDKYGERREAILEELAELTGEYNRIKQSIELINTSIRHMKDLEGFYRRKIKEIDSDLEKTKIKEKKQESPTDLIRSIEQEINHLYNEINTNTEYINSLNMKINEIIEIITKNRANIELTKKSIQAIKERKKRLRDKRSFIISEIKRVDKEISSISSSIKKLEREKEELEKQLEKYNEEMRIIEDKIDKLNSLKNQLYDKWKQTSGKLSSLQRVETKLSYNIRSIKFRMKENEETILKLGYTIEELDTENLNLEKLEKVAEDIEKENEEIKTETIFPSPTAYIEYKEKYEPYKLFTINKAKLEEEKEAILNFIREIDEEKERTFMEGFAKIRERFTRLIKHVFPDSEVYMDLEDPEDIDSGLAVYVRLKDKPQLPIISASGGEKSLFIILFLLAVYSLPGNVVYLLDEIDAHIDPRNLNKFASALELQKTESQIIYVTLPRDEALPRVSDHLIGIFFRRGVSRPVVIPNNELFRVIR